MDRADCTWADEMDRADARRERSKQRYFEQRRARRQAASEAAHPHPPGTFKTRLCRNWVVSGKCRYGRRCQFAHGRCDLRCRPAL